LFFFFQAEDGIRDIGVLEFRRVLFRSVKGRNSRFMCINKMKWNASMTMI